MTTINISCQHSNQTPITFKTLCDLKKDWHVIYENNTYNDLYVYLSDLMESINNDVLKQNKIRYKQFQRQKQSDDVQPHKPVSDWRSMKSVVKQSALSSQLEGTDKIKLALNRELNKLSPSNFELIISSVQTIFIDFITNSVVANGSVPEFSQKELISMWNEYVQHLWFSVINKTLTQTNYSDIYFRFINKFICMSNDEFIDKWKSYAIQILDHDVVVKVVEKLYGIVSFNKLENNKTNLVSEMIAFMKNSNYLVGHNMLYELLGNVVNNSCENIFNTLGKFVKYFTESERANGRKLSRAEKNAYDILLLALYDNFKTINDLVQWEPVNMDELEKRVYFTIGFFHDNRRFIQGLDMDFYRDMECQLDSLKRTDTIPTTIKYKLFDCIDNFISCRLSGN